MIIHKPYLLISSLVSVCIASDNNEWIRTNSDFERGVGVADIVFEHFPVNANGDTYHREFFSCRKGSVINRLTTFFRPGNDFPKRIWAFGCRPLGNYSEEQLTENCQLSDGLVQADGNYVLCAKPNSFVNGVGRLSNDGGQTYIYQVRCCQVLRLSGGSRELVQLAFETCKDYPLVEEEDSSDVVFSASEVTVGFITSLVSNQTWDRSWKRRMCDFRESEADQSSSKAFPTKCKVAMMSLTGKEVDNATRELVETKMFRSTRLSLDDCLKQCNDLPFCTSIRYNGDGLCRFTYARPNAAATKQCRNKITIKARLDKDFDVWIPCWDCPN